MTTYTKLTKPNGTSYTNLNSQGKEQYDQSTITYDNANTFYDGINQSQYINVVKPSFKQTTVLAGMTVGLLIPLTNAHSFIINTDRYTRVAKPT